MSSDSPAAILFDEQGHPVGVLFDGVVYRLQVSATLSDGYNTLGVPDNPIAVEGSTTGTPVVVAGLDPNDNIAPVFMSTSGGLSVRVQDPDANQTLMQVLDELKKISFYLSYMGNIEIK